MRVVLGEVAHAQHPVQRTRRLVAMHLAELGDAVRQVAIALQSVLIDLHVARAVHRLAAEHALVRQDGREHVLTVVLPVTGEFPEVLLHHVGRIHFLVPGALLLTAHIRNQRLEKRPALGVPEDGARRFFLEMEQIHLAAELSVVALLGFLELMQIGFQLVLGREGGAVDALQLRIVAVAAPIGACEFHQLERLADLTGRGHVRTAAEIEPFALLVDLQVFAGGDRVDEFDLEDLALVAEELLGVIARPELLCERRVLGDDLAHLLFDLRNVFRLERLLLGEVVEEAVVDHRADGHLGAGPQRLHGFRHDVRGVVPDQLQGCRIGAGDEIDRNVFVDRVGQIRQHAVELHSDGSLGERWRYGFCDFEARRSGFDLALFAVGERNCDVGHVGPPVLTRRQRARRKTMSRPLMGGPPVQVKAS